MRWIRFTAAGRTAYGILEGNDIVEVTGDPSRFAGRAVLVTGAASGIGAATARLFASEGANVAMIDINPDRGPVLSAGTAIVLRADVSCEGQVLDSLATTVSVMCLRLPSGNRANDSSRPSTFYR